MVEFFDALTGFEKVLWIMAIPASLVFLIQFLMIFLGLDTDSDLDMDVDTSIDMEVDTDVDNAQSDTGASFGWFSFKNLINFFVMFSWTGIMCISNGVTMGWSTLWATLAGFGMVVMMTVLMYGMKKLAANYTPQVTETIGKTGTVTLRITPTQTGKVNILYGGAIREMSAISLLGDIERGSFVEVISVDGNILKVKQV